MEDTTKFFKILLRLHEPQILKTVALVCPDGGDVATPVPHSQGTSVHFVTFYLAVLSHRDKPWNDLFLKKTHSSISFLVNLSLQMVAMVWKVVGLFTGHNLGVREVTAMLSNAS